MKERYSSPELEQICLTATERLASEETDVSLDVDNVLGKRKNSTAVNPSKDDIDIPLEVSL